MATDDQLSELLGKNAELFATYEEWANGQIMLLAGTVDDPNSFNETGGKDGALGYYPVVNVSGQTIYVACVARLKAIALGGANAAVLEGLVGQVGGKLAAVDTKLAAVDDHIAAKDVQIGAAITSANASAGNADGRGAYASAQGDRAKAQADAIGDISAARAQALAAAAQSVDAAATSSAAAANERAARLSSVAPATADENLYRFTTSLGWEIGRLSEKGIVIGGASLTETGISMPDWSIGARDGAGALRLSSSLGWEIAAIGTDGTIDTALFSVGPVKVSTPVVSFQLIPGIDGVVFTTDLGWILDVGGSSASGPDIGTVGRLAWQANTVVIFGHSKVDQNSYAGHGSGGISRLSDLGFYAWAQYYLRGSMELLYNAGIGGQDTPQILSRITSDVIAYAPAWCMLQGGTCNDIHAGTSADTIIATQAAILDKLTAAGIRTIALTDPTWADGHGDLTPVNVEKLERANRALLRAPLTRPGVVAIDTAGTIMNPLSTTGAAKAGMIQLDDYIHPLPRGARAQGKLIADRLVALGFQVLDFLPKSLAEAYSFANAGRQLLDNPLMQGATGANNAGDTLTGPIPTGYGVSKGGTWGTAMVKSATPARADGYGNDWVLTITNTGAVDDYLVLTGPDVSARCAEGDVLQAAAEIGITGMSKVKEHDFFMFAGNGTTTLTASALSRDDAANWDSSCYDQSDLTGGVLPTGPVKVPAGGTPTGIKAYFRIRFDGAGGTAVIRIGRAAMFKR